LSPNRGEDDDEDDPFAAKPDVQEEPAPVRTAAAPPTARPPAAPATTPPAAAAPPAAGRGPSGPTPTTTAAPNAPAAAPAPPAVVPQPDRTEGDDDLWASADDDAPVTPRPPAAAGPATAPTQTAALPRPNEAALVAEGLDAYRRRDYRAALETWLPLARGGNADAQFYVGGLYMDGSGVPEDVIQAHAWWQLASEQEHARAKEFLTLVKSVMDDDQIKKAGELVTRLRPVRRQ
jgi:hypothetical protein